MRNADIILFDAMLDIGDPRAGADKKNTRRTRNPGSTRSSDTFSPMHAITWGLRYIPPNLDGDPKVHLEFWRTMSNKDCK